MTLKRANLMIFLLFIIISGLNVNVLFTFGHIEYSNQTQIVTCYSSNATSNNFMSTWNKVKIYVLKISQLTKFI